MNKKDLEVGMVLRHNTDHGNTRRITAIGERLHLYIHENGLEYSDHGEYMENWEPVKEKKKITLYRYTWNTKTYEDKYTRQSKWVGFSFEELFNGAPSVICLKTETKEIEIDD